MADNEPEWMQYEETPVTTVKLSWWRRVACRVLL